MENQNTAVTVLTLLFGVLIGIMSVISLLFFSGVISVDRPITNEGAPAENINSDFAPPAGVGNDKGIGMSVDKLEGFDDVISLSCDSKAGCNSGSGNLTCDKILPMACVNSYGRNPLPTGLPDAKSGSWTMGEIGFTEPIVGNSIKTADDGHSLCEQTFGDGWRMLNNQDGNSALSVTGIGTVVRGSLAWIDISNNNSSNCWTPRAEYN